MKTLLSNKINAQHIAVLVYLYYPIYDGILYSWPSNPNVLSLDVLVLVIFRIHVLVPFHSSMHQCTLIA